MQKLIGGGGSANLPYLVVTIGAGSPLEFGGSVQASLLHESASENVANRSQDGEDAEG
jgi:hypothetical protein